MVKDIGEGPNMGIEQKPIPSSQPPFENKGGLVLPFARATSAPGAPTAVAPPEVKKPEIKKVKKRLNAAARIGISTAAILGGIEAVGAGVNEQVNKQPVSTQTIKADLAWPWNLTKSAVEDIQGLFNKQKQILHEGTLAPQPGESVSWWQELPQEKIQELAKTPEINIIGEQYILTVNPVLQEKAKQAGYEIIYQGDPNDTTGRTVVTKDRQADPKDWATEDLGFGETWLYVRGVFKAWVPKPNDSQQQNDVYALLENPLTKEAYLVDINLRPSDSSSLSRTFFVVDDLNQGPNDVKKMIEKTGYWMSSDSLPDNPDDPNARYKKLTDSPSFNDLLRKQELALNNLAKPGDYITVRKQVARETYNEDGVPNAISFTVRRFGGESEWKQENGLQ